MIEPARLPDKPYKPNRRAILIIGIIFGISAGLTTIFLQEFSDQSVRDADVLLYSGLTPVLASVPDIITSRDKNITNLKRIISIVIIVIAISYGVIALRGQSMDINTLKTKVMELRGQLGF